LQILERLGQAQIPLGQVLLKRDDDSHAGESRIGAPAEETWRQVSGYLCGREAAYRYRRKSAIAISTGVENRK
jgi:hypothetical protein